MAMIYFLLFAIDQRPCDLRPIAAVSSVKLRQADGIRKLAGMADRPRHAKADLDNSAASCIDEPRRTRLFSVIKSSHDT
jgi:hypothetical protein